MALVVVATAVGMTVLRPAPAIVRARIRLRSVLRTRAALVTTASRKNEAVAVVRRLLATANAVDHLRMLQSLLVPAVATAATTVTAAVTVAVVAMTTAATKTSGTCVVAAMTTSVRVRTRRVIRSTTTRANAALLPEAAGVAASTGLKSDTAAVRLKTIAVPRDLRQEAEPKARRSRASTDVADPATAVCKWRMLVIDCLNALCLRVSMSLGRQCLNVHAVEAARRKSVPMWPFVNVAWAD